MTRIVLALAVAVLAIASDFPCLAEATPRKAAYSLVTESWPPFRMNDEASPSGFSGIDIDLAKELERRCGIAIEIQRRPWARALEMLRFGEADLVTGVARTEEREAYLAYVGKPYTAVQPVFYAPRGKGAAVASYDDLYGRSVGYSLNSAYFEPFNSDAKLNKVGLSTEEQILKVLALGRLDVAIGTDPNMSWDVARLGLKGDLEKTRYQPASKTDLYVAVSRKSAAALDLVPALAEALRVMLADGTIEAILKKYR